MTHLPTTLNQPHDYHWSPANQRAFLEHLAIIGSVTLAAKHVGMSARAAYDLKLRRDGAAFKLGWAAAVLIARGRLGDDLLERAIHGYDEEYVRTPADENGEVRIRRRRIDSRLGMEYLKRLDRMADTVAENAGELQLAQVIMGDWEAFLDRLAPADSEDGGVAAVACWLAGRDNRFNSLSGLWEKPYEDCEVAQISAVFGEGDGAESKPELSPEEAAAEMSVWYCDHVQSWRTNFPPPPDFCGEEDGEFGDDSYERDLSEEEAEMRSEQADAEVAPLRKAGEAARRAWFGLGDGDRNEPRPPTPSLCHPRVSGDPWPEVALGSEHCVESEAQTMDPRMHGDDNDGDEKDVGPEAEPEITGRTQPTIRTVGGQPIKYYGNTGIPMHAAQLLGMGRDR